MTFKKTYRHVQGYLHGSIQILGMSLRFQIQIEIKMSKNQTKIDALPNGHTTAYFSGLAQTPL